MRGIALTALVLMLCAVLAHAVVPRTVSYQGILRDGEGDIVPDGTYSVEFNIYDVQSGGTALWTEAQSVSVTGGIFDVTLGELVYLGLPFDVPYWLGITVETESELVPRVELTAAPFALRAAVADSVKPTAVVDDGDWERSGTSVWHDGFVGIGPGSVVPSYPLDVWGTARFRNTAQFADGLVADYIDPENDFYIARGFTPFVYCQQSGGYVGIGTFAPLYDLDVDGTVNCTGLRLPTGAAEGQVLTSDASGNAAWQPVPLKSGKFNCADDYAVLVDCNGAQLLQNGARNEFRIHSDVGDASACYAYYLDGSQVSKAALYEGTNYDFTIPFGSTPYHAEVILSRPWGGGAVARVDIYYENGRCGGIWHSSH